MVKVFTACSIDLQTGALSDPECVAHCLNPSYLAWGHSRQCLYATQELGTADSPALVSFSPTGNGQLHLLNRVSLSGEYPCHLAVDSTERCLASAQYGSGDIAIYKLNKDGQIGELLQLIKHTGRGPNADRQEGPHAHYAGFHTDNNLLIAVDLGIDKVIGYSVDPASDHIADTPAFSIQTVGGAGPRHLAILSGTNTAYLYCELTADIYQLALSKSAWQCIESVQAFSEVDTSEHAAAAIRISPDQRHLYVSGRDLSKIAGFAIDPHSKQLTSLASFDTGGICPRDFSLTPDGAFVVVANQLSNNLVSLRRNADSGMLEASGFDTAIGSPVCVLF